LRFSFCLKNGRRCCPFFLGVLTIWVRKKTFTFLHVSIKVYDVSGKEIACPDLLGETLLYGDVEEGEHSALLNTNQFSKGIYLENDF